MKTSWLKITLVAALATTTLLAPAPLPAAPPYHLSPQYAQAVADAEAGTPKPAGPDIAADVNVTVNGKRHRSREAMVQFGGNVLLPSNETAQVVVVLGGDARVNGQVKDVVVVIGGNATVAGEVQGEVVAVGGNVKLLPGAKIEGDVVSVGGQVEQDAEATVGGDVQQVSLGAGLPRLDWIKEWLVECVFKLRPLSFKVGWVWLVALGFFLLYLLTAVALRRPVTACVRQLEERPATTFLAGLLGKLLIPILIGLLSATVVGLLGVPFLLVAVVVAVLIGKVALFEFLGLAVGRVSGQAMLQKPLVAFLVGWVIVTLLCVVPILGLLLVGVTSLWGFGAALMAMFARSRQERPPTPPPANPLPYAPLVPVAPVFPVGSAPLDPAMTGPAPLASGLPGGAVPPVQPAVLPEALTFPRASFWQRMGAGFLDLILIGVVAGSANVGGLFPLVTVAYFGGMWAWKQTTIGGIVVGLRVARLDGRPLEWPVALVRTLGAWLSTVVFFLGFFWIAWDADRQGWHDRLAGTVVVKLPRGTPLVML